MLGAGKLSSCLAKHSWPTKQAALTTEEDEHVF